MHRGFLSFNIPSQKGHARLRLKVFALAAIACLPLAACSDYDSVSVAELPIYATPVEPDQVGLRLAQAAEKATMAQNKMAQIEAFRTPLPQQQGLAYPLPGLTLLTSMSWSGPIEQVSRTLAEMAGMTFKKVGKEPPLPMVVAVDAHQQPIGKILTDIGAQAGRRADLIIDPNTRTLELRYAPTDGLNYY